MRPVARTASPVAAIALVALSSLASCGWLDSAPIHSADVSSRDAFSRPDLAPPPPALVIELENFFGWHLSGINFTHSVARGFCPVTLAYIRATNETSVPAQLTMTVTPSAGIRVGKPSPLEIVPGQFYSIGVQYDCVPNQPVQAVLKITFASALDSETRAFPIDVTFTDVPVGRCDNVVDMSAIATAKSPLSELATAASAACLASGPPPPAAAWATCTQVGLVSKAHISGACASCYVDALACWESRCAAACEKSPGDCARCSTEQGCLAAFYACSALDPLSACDGAPCDVQSATGCAGDNRVTYQGPGVCYDGLGSPACQFPAAMESSCEPGFPCVGGACPADPTVYEFAPTASYVTTASVAFDGVGLDLDGDGKPDNELTTVLGLLAQFLDMDLDQAIQAAVDAGEAVVLLEFPNLSDLSASPLQTVNALIGRALDPATLSGAGLGTFEVDLASSFSPSTGAPAFGLAGEIVDGELSASTGSGVMRFQTSGALTLGANGVGPDIDTGMVAGALAIGDVAAMLNAGSADCDCLGLPPGVPRVVVLTTDPTKLKLGCSPAHLQTVPTCLEGTDAPHCVALTDKRAALCPSLALLPFDLDTDGDGRKDAVSFALEFTAVSAAIVGGY